MVCKNLQQLMLQPHSFVRLRTNACIAVTFRNFAGDYGALEDVII